jgi:hypothetical protein
LSCDSLTINSFSQHSFTDIPMQAKKVGCFLCILLLFSAVIGSVHAEPTTVTFHGVGVTIDLTFPEEAHPAESISHNISITANTDLTLQNFTIFIYAPVGPNWQEIKNQTITNLDLSENQSFTSRLGFTLPQEANGTLSCFLYVLTSKSTDYLSITFYTTRVSVLTFSEMQSLYNEMLANYTSLVEDYDGLLANYSSLLTEYETLLSQHNSLSAQYASSVSTYETLLTNFNT